MAAELPPEATIASMRPVDGAWERAADADGRGAYEPKATVIARQIREAILGGHLAPGARIRQEALGRELGVSRIPVREALRQLEAEGLVSLTPRSGARVARLDLAEHHEVYRLREALEPIAIAESARHITDAQLAELRLLLERVEAAVGDPRAWLARDREFHLAAYAAAPLPRLTRMIEELWNTTQQYRRAFVMTLDAEGLELVNAEHRLILAALERGDADDAELRQRAHIRRTRVTLMAHADVFDLATTEDNARTEHPLKEIPL